MLEGSARKYGNRLRVAVQLIDVADGYHRWAHRFDGSLEDVFAIEDEIAESVATALRGVLSAREKDALRRPETAVEAYDCFLRGRQLLHKFERASIEMAQKMFARAIELKPDDQSVLINGACLRAQAGLKEEALKLLEHCFAQGWGKRDWIEHDPDYDSIRDEPRFQALLSQLH